MSPILVAVLLNLIGLAVFIASWIQVVRDEDNLYHWPLSCRYLGALSIGAAGCVLMATAHYELGCLLYNRAQRTDDLLATQLTLQEPLRMVYFRASGGDPFADQSDSRVLKFRAIVPGGPTLVINVLPNQLKKLNELEAENVRVYAIAWQALNQSVVTDDDRSVIASLHQLNDFRRFGQAEIELVDHTENRNAVPTRLEIILSVCLKSPFRRRRDNGTLGMRYQPGPGA